MNNLENLQKKLLAVHMFMVLMFVILAINVWYLTQNFEDVSEHEIWVRHTHDVINSTKEVEASINEAESAIRGYALRGMPQYLEPFREQSLAVWQHVNQLKEITKDNPDQQKNIELLSALIRSRIEPLEKLAQFKKMTPAERTEAFDQGFTRMEILKNHLKKITDQEHSLLKERASAADRSRKFFEWNVIGSFALTVMMILVAYALIISNEKKNHENLQNRKLQQWLQNQAMEVSQLVIGSGGLERACEQVLQFLANSSQALAGRLYLKESGRLVLAGSFAAPDSGPAGDIPQSIQGKTLVAEALRRKDIWVIDDVPPDALRISTSLALARPATLVLVPLQFQNNPLAVIELAFLGKPSADALQMLEHVRETISIHLNAAAVKAQLQSLLEETQQQAEELQTQQEELRTNNEELEQQARALEMQQDIVRRQNEQLETSKAALEIKANDLQKTSQYKSDFLAKMSHELRTPLNSLLILATLLIENKERNLTDQQKDFAKTMYNSGNDLLNLINDILDLSKIEARKLNLRFEDFALSGFFERLRQTFEPQAAGKKVEFRVEIDSEIRNVNLNSDPLRLEQVLRNFLSNAIKFTESGSVTLKAKIHDSKEGTIRINVQDTGVGIPDNKKELIFEAFEQADGTVSRKFGGTGLGLTISRELASLLGGRIEVASEEGKGSEFALIIPLRYSAKSESAVLIQSPVTKSNLQVVEKLPEASEISAAAKDAVERVQKEKDSILIVEDDRPFRQAIVETVQAYDFQAIEADSSEVALQILQIHIPTAILLDIKLPGMSGLGLLEMVKQNPKLRHIPVHMISALEYQTNALRMGALGYLNKPVTVDKVRAALTRIESMLKKKVKNLLIIEDDDRQRDAVAQLVSGQDIHALLARTGKEAISLVNDKTIDCIILDLNLPDMSGFDFLEKLNSLPISVPPVVVYTGKDLSRDEEMSLRKYSESIIIKGARSPERLLDEVNLFLHRVESLLPQDKQDILQHLRSQEKAFEGKKVLLVDDDLRNVFALTSALESKGLQIRIAKNGLEALDALDQYPDTDLVLMDLMMPKMDGLECIRQIRTRPQLKDLPIIALTAKAMKEDQEKCIEAGANDYLSKPLNLGNLLSVMRVWLTPKGIFS